MSKHGVPCCIDELKQHRFVGYIEDMIHINEVRWLFDAIEDPNIVFRSTSMVAQHNAAAAGMGLVMTPSFPGLRDSRLSSVHIEGLLVKRDLWLATHEDLRYMARVKAVMEFVKRIIQRDAAFLDRAEVRSSA